MKFIYKIFFFFGGKASHLFILHFLVRSVRHPVRTRHDHANVDVTGMRIPRKRISFFENCNPGRIKMIFRWNFSKRKGLYIILYLKIWLKKNSVARADRLYLLFDYRKVVNKWINKPPTAFSFFFRDIIYWEVQQHRRNIFKCSSCI